MNERLIPSRFREDNFRRFEPILEQLLTVWPKPVIITPNSLSSETFACRFRDAITAYLRPTNLWESIIDREKLRKIREEMVVRQLEGKVVISRPVSRVDSKIDYETSTGMGERVTPTELEFGQCTEQELIAFAILLNSGKLGLSVRLASVQFSIEFANSIRDKFPNIQLEQNDNYWIIM